MGGTVGSSHGIRTPPAAAPGAFSVQGDPISGGNEPEIVALRPSHALPAPVGGSGGGARATDLASDRLRCEPDYRSRVQKSQVARSSDLG